MDPLLSPEEIRLLELLESKNYDALTAEERAFVETQLDAAEYQLQRRIISDAAFGETLIPQPRPLFLPQPAATKPLFSRTVPVYQAVLAIAAVFVCFFLLWPDETPAGLTGSIVAQDTILPQRAESIATTKVIHDTVVQHVPIYKSNHTEQSAPSESFREMEDPQAGPVDARPTELRSTLVLPKLKPENLVTSGTSLKDDQLSFLVPDINGFQRR